MDQLSVNMLSGVIVALILIMPLAYKWQIKMVTAFLGACVFGLLSGILSYNIGRSIELARITIIMFQGTFILTMASASAVFMFYRDPERTPPLDGESIVSPADGTVLYVKRVTRGEVPLSLKNGRTLRLTELAQADILNDGLYLIGIGMNLLNVHVNRAPIGGVVRLLKPVRGSFLSLKAENAVLKNERFTTVIDNGSYLVGVVQIASRLVRRIETYVHEGQKIQKGERIGMIKFGSQVDLILPQVDGLEVTVTPGDELKAGESIIARLQNYQAYIKEHQEHEYFVESH
ncbi:MAG: phosphatidylserine decarboxylase family protein [Actinobacteria bacterium]|nr:phosphatidylserine decarboxylase family protein [Actinomycetota bacterium]